MVLHSKQCDATRLAPRCSFSIHPDRKFCCYGDAAFAKWTYPHLLLWHCQVLLITRNKSNELMPWCAVRSKSFRLTRDVETDGSVSDWPRSASSESGWFEASAARRSHQSFTYAMFTFRVWLICRWRGIIQSSLVLSLPAVTAWPWLCLVGVVVIVVLSWERKQTLNSANQWQRERSQVTWMALHCPDSEGRLGWSREGTASCLKINHFYQPLKCTRVYLKL